MILLEDYNLRPWEVDALDPDFIDDLMIYRTAKSDHATAEQRKVKRG